MQPAAPAAAVGLLSAAAAGTSVAAAAADDDARAAAASAGAEAAVLCENSIYVGGVRARFQCPKVLKGKFKGFSARGHTETVQHGTVPLCVVAHTRPRVGSVGRVVLVRVI